MLKQDTIEVTRDCEGTLIPSGVKVTIQKGSLVMITQALGNSYTVYVNGNLARVAGKDGDALGMIILDELDINTLSGSLEDKIWELLKTCFDPEIPVNIVDLGLVYECKITPADDKYAVEIKMTLTAPGCGMGPVLVADIEQKIRSIHEVADLKVDLIFDPPWDRSMMTDVAKLQLGML
ncbi:MAG TPA: putative Fe-S cluster assembly protein SufT [Gammaproteobacteria bacterium]|nr:putative Fe-S cluster assembly protein SufT [Gammaproteobacteria bacterium]